MIEVEIPQRKVAVLGGSGNGGTRVGARGSMFATWLHALRAPTGSNGERYRLVDCGGWWAYVPEAFTIRARPA